MKRVIFGIFAHPDDEAFLPSGSLLKWVSQGGQLHLICATRGEKGQNPDNVADLGATRETEWRTAGQLMKASSQTQLGYPDGELSNNLFHKLASDVEHSIEESLSKLSEPSQIDIVTYEECGITGHLDHIAVSYVSSYVFMQLQPRLSSKGHQTRLLYACACRAIAPAADTSFVFMPKGHAHRDIDITEDVSEVLELKREVMRAHKSQRSDGEKIIQQLGNNLKFEHFRIFKH